MGIILTCGDCCAVRSSSVDGVEVEDHDETCSVNDR
jgi:hypothetical protein